MSEEPEVRQQRDLISRPEEIIYRSCYASADLEQMLQNAEKRSAIRRLPPAQLFFSIKELDESQIFELLPHITEEQWATVLDLDLWTKDQLNPDRFVSWQRHILFTEDAVARKLLRATDFEAWAFAVKRSILIFARGEDGEFSEEALNYGQYETPDGLFLIGLPRNAERARLWHQLLQRLYQLEPRVALALLDSCRFQTSAELEETAYQNRRRRIEDLGFQDYFEAIEIYSPRDCDEKLPEKKRQTDPGVLPARFRQSEAGNPLLLFRALAALGKEKEIQLLIEELFYVCNKLLSADRIPPDEPAQVKRVILKALSCLNLGLDCWSCGDIGKAIQGISRHYLLSFFQIGFGRLIELQKEAQLKSKQGGPIPGSFLEAALEALSRPFPELAEQFEGKIRTRFFKNEADLSWGKQLIEQLSLKDR